MKTLFIASVNATSGMYTGQMFNSEPKPTIFEAVKNLQDRTCSYGISADWTKVLLDTYELRESREISVSAESQESA